MPSTYEILLQSIGQAFFLLGLLAVMVSIPWVGAAIEDWYHGPDDDDEGDAA